MRMRGHELRAGTSGRARCGCGRGGGGLAFGSAGAEACKWWLRAVDPWMESGAGAWFGSSWDVRCAGGALLVLDGLLVRPHRNLFG